jgi:lipopolysaccharide/colanic/teichoic acid biosynthesis glycosyltransferase
MYLKAKRVMDIIAGVLGLVILSPVLLGCALAVRLTSAGPVLFRQTRVGRGGRRFEVLKFRSMTDGTAGPSITGARDPRITRVGRVLRHYKLDELPQLLNVVQGDMSLVGPRPELPRYVDIFPLEYSRILAVRPGLTDFAAIEYRDEEGLLALSVDPELAYVEEILPAKIQLYFKYLDHLSLRTDLSLIGKTVRAVIG